MSHSAGGRVITLTGAWFASPSQGIFMHAMTIYGARIFDLAQGRFLFTAPGVRDPYRLGQVVAAATAALVDRDGLDPERLELRLCAQDEAGIRELDEAELAAMDEGLRDSDTALAA